MADMAMQTGLTPGMVASMGAAGIAGMDVSTIMSTNVAGLGSKAVQGVAEMAKAGDMDCWCYGRHDGSWFSQSRNYGCYGS
ncbi:MAG: hypothetical protein CM15mP31_4130 [Gammaproteobacteria bacterium]|nr:MAG: hypothetical protein CM15mP31_4130 [Gammaproteobacteria bacterium]